MAQKRASAIVMTRCPDSFFETEKTDGVPPSFNLGATPDSFFAGLPVFYTRHVPYLFKFVCCDATGRDPLSVVTQQDLKGHRAFLFSGIARNKGFYKTAQDLGVQVAGHLEFMDHYGYKRADFFRIRQQAAAANANLILTTEKDWSRIDPHIEWGCDFAVIGISIQFSDPQAFDALIGNVIEKEKRK